MADHAIPVNARTAPRGDLPHRARETLAPWHPEDARDAVDEFVMDGLKEKWAGLYDLGSADGEYHAFRLIGGHPLTASTLAGLDSAIRADFHRQGTR